MAKSHPCLLQPGGAQSAGLAVHHQLGSRLGRGGVQRQQSVQHGMRQHIAAAIEEFDPARMLAGRQLDGGETEPLLEVCIGTGLPNR